MARITAWLVLAIIVLAVVGSTSRDAAAMRVTVPNVLGKDGLTAQTALERAGLRWAWDDGTPASPTNGFFLTDRIYGQTFVGRSVRRGTLILLTPASHKIVTLADLLPPAARLYGTNRG